MLQKNIIQDPKKVERREVKKREKKLTSKAQKGFDFKVQPSCHC